MTNEAELLKAFKDKGVFSGNELIIFKEFCNDFIYACKIAGLAVMGVESFHLLKDGNVEPNLDEIADFSDIEDGKIDKYIFGHSPNTYADKTIEAL